MRFFHLLFLFTQMAFSQVSQVTLEDKIYNAVDVFVANPNAENLRKLEIEENFFNAKTKPEFLALVILNCNKAYFENQFSLTNKAISTYEKAWQLYQKNKLSNYDITEYCLKPLGNLYTIIGDYDSAENTIKQYFFIANIDENQQQKISAILNLSNVYQSSGKSDLAIILIEKTLKTEKLTPSQKGMLLNNLGTNYLITKNNEKAKKALETSIKLLSGNKLQSQNLSNAFRNLSQIYSQEKNFVLANSYFEKAQSEFIKTKNQEPRKIAKLFYEKALLFFEQNRINDAKLSINEVYKVLIPNYNSKNILPNQKSLYAETLLLDVLDLQAVILLKENKPKTALESYMLSFYIEDLFQSLLVYENSKIISQTRIRSRAEKCIEIYDYLYQKEKNGSYVEKAFLLSEKTKSIVLKNYISQGKTISKEEKVILEQLQNWNNTIVREQQKLGLADISKINFAIKKQNELMLLLKSIKSKYRNSSKENINLISLFQKLDKDKAILISYFSGAENMYSFTLQNHKIKLQKIENANQSNSSIRRFITYFSDANAITNDVSGYNNLGNQVYKYLKLPQKSEDKNLIIIPDGILNFFPFEAMITEKSTTTNFAKMHYLLNDFVIGYNNSVSFYLDEKPFQYPKETILGVFPIFENSNLELSFSKKELENLKNGFEGKYLEKSEATFKNFKANASHFSILHLSTHASSGNVDEPASIRFYDQEILYSELYNLNINPNLVVLSACETGLGKLYKSEGAMSVARGFQFAGSQNILFSLWKVNDYTTSLFMDKFYKNIKKGNSYFGSNQQAKLDFLKDKSISNAKKSPYYWSAMIYYGTLENVNTTNYWIWISVVGILIVFLFWFLYRKKLNFNM
ncbi:MAG: CHAT domain-containing tetratricopeptide repeat protein [Flavobacterium sp.]|uniref:CHAT domain-containing protein n=1 Tax=Flavobacterium sp. TaxID=239 RepID=UPI003263B9C6